MKFGVLGAAYGDYLIGFEQVIDVNHSMNFNVGYWNLNSGLINIGYLLRNEDKLWAKEGGSGWTGSLEQRNYFDFGRDTINRFYWGPYFRFWGNSLVLNDYIRNDFVTQQQLFEAETKFSGVGAGLQLGYQWMITDRLWLDFYFLGFGVERVNMSARYKAIGVDEFDYEIIKADVEGAFNGRAEFIKESVKVRTFDELLIVDLPFIIPSFRAGFNVAIILD